MIFTIWIRWEVPLWSNSQIRQKLTGYYPWVADPVVEDWGHHENAGKEAGKGRKGKEPEWPTPDASCTRFARMNRPR
jgi:hypothetical protein